MVWTFLSHLPVSCQNGITNLLQKYEGYITCTGYNIIMYIPQFNKLVLLFIRKNQHNLKEKKFSLEEIRLRGVIKFTLGHTSESNVI